MTSVVSFIMVASILAYALLVLAFVIKEYIIMLISGMAILSVGIFMAIHNVESINNLLTQSFALISICIGMYVFINSSKEKIEELM